MVTNSWFPNYSKVLALMPKRIPIKAYDLLLALNRKCSLLRNSYFLGSTENDQHQKMINMAKSENDQHLNLWLLMKKESDQHQKMINMAKSENDQHLNLWLLMKKFKFFY